MGWITESVKQTEQIKELKETGVSDKEITDWMLSKQDGLKKNFCCLLYGKDGTGKSGIVQDYVNNLKEDEKIVIIDLDGGNVPLFLSYHKDKSKNFIIKNPLETSNDGTGTEIDYAKTFAKIKGAIRWVKNNHQKYKIKAFVFDGLSTALKHAERQMRLDKHLDVDGGVQTRYWLVRNKIFEETLEQIKALPVDAFFIAHDDFIITNEKDIASIKLKTNQMMWQKIRCIREVKNNAVIYKAIIDKSKYNVNAEGQEIVFCEVNKSEQKYKWDTKKIFDILILKEK